MLETYFGAEEEEDEGMTPAVANDGAQFTFGAGGGMPPGGAPGTPGGGFSFGGAAPGPGAAGGGGYTFG